MTTIFNYALRIEKAVLARPHLCHMIASPPREGLFLLQIHFVRRADFDFPNQQ